MIPRKYKILVAHTHDKPSGEKLLQNILINCGFAQIHSDARKIIAPGIDSINLDTCHFVACFDFNFSKSHLLTHRLIRMALQGIPIMISTRRIPNSILQFCEVYTSQR